VPPHLLTPMINQSTCSQPEGPWDDISASIKQIRGQHAPSRCTHAGEDPALWDWQPVALGPPDAGSMNVPGGARRNTLLCGSAIALPFVHALLDRARLGDQSPSFRKRV